MPTPRGRKRASSGDDQAGAEKRTRRQSRQLPGSSVRNVSPSKNVHFPRDLIMGPYASDPTRRSSSPVRPALLKREAARGTPDAQLQAEQDSNQPCQKSVGIAAT